MQDAQELEDIEKHKVLAIVAYLGFLVLIPALAAPNSKFARFHVNQGAVLFAATVAYAIVTTAISEFFGVVSVALAAISIIIFNLGYLGLFALMLLGIRNAYKGERKQLPYLGRYRILK